MFAAAALNRCHAATVQRANDPGSAVNNWHTIEVWRSAQLVTLQWLAGGTEVYAVDGLRKPTREVRCCSVPVRPLEQCPLRPFRRSASDSNRSMGRIAVSVAAVGYDCPDLTISALGDRDDEKAPDDIARSAIDWTVGKLQQRRLCCVPAIRRNYITRSISSRIG